MISSERIRGLVFHAVDAFNDTLPPERRLDCSVDEILIGPASKLDSLGLVNLIVGVEETLEDDLHLSLTLADEKAFAQRSSPFRTLGTLVDYVTELVECSAKS